jgi:3-oxoacyl-[acyl-carrier-protein] synthase II
VKKVYITGTGLVSSLGNSVSDAFAGLLANKSGVRRMEGWENYVGLKSWVGAPAAPYDSAKIDRAARRTMSPMSEMAYIATQQALGQADFHDPSSIRSALIMGSTSGSPKSFQAFYKKYFEVGGPKGQLGTSFFKVMNHSVASNVAVAIGFKGPVLSPGSACATSTQAIAMGWELLQTGLYDYIIAGGADELDVTSTAIFDIVGAASAGYNETPEKTARPFDRDRDGLVVSEGAGVVVLETEEHMKRRGVKPLVELISGNYFCDGKHMAHPDDEAMGILMRNCLERGNLAASDIDYVNAHATATTIGDVQEVKATYQVFGSGIPVSSLKGHFGHSLAACGVIEAISCIEMMRTGVLIGTRNLENPDPECHIVDLIGANREKKVDRVMVNNFAFGGISSSIILGRAEG